MSAGARRIHAHHPFGEALREPLAAAFPERGYVVWTDDDAFRRGIGDVEVLVTPHVAGLSRDYMARIGRIFIENVRRCERGEPLQNEIDRARGY
jgi:phosphoglycerate dehydrogenase-like enzyme